MKRGFGLIEVLVAAVVLGFLIIGLNTLQKGNREAVIRIRARDAANVIAQNVLDSLAATGLHALAEKEGLVHDSTYTHSFDGGAGKVEMDYEVKVSLLDDTKEINNESTYFNNSERIISQSLEATVSWNFKKSTQSITMAKVVR